jgi:hypothetical protein
LGLSLQDMKVIHVFRTYDLIILWQFFFLNLLCWILLDIQ